jgi:hypothetical protein
MGCAVAAFPPLVSVEGLTGPPGRSLRAVGNHRTPGLAGVGNTGITVGLGAARRSRHASDRIANAYGRDL